LGYIAPMTTTKTIEAVESELAAEQAEEWVAEHFGAVAAAVARFGLEDAVAVQMMLVTDEGGPRWDDITPQAMRAAIEGAVL